MDTLIIGTPELNVDQQFLVSAHRMLADLVAGGAALGWADPPSPPDVATLVNGVASAARKGDAALYAAYLDGNLAGLGYWRRRIRPVHWPHADLEKLAVAPGAQGRGIGRALTSALVQDARKAGIEVLTLDARGDNVRALHLYQSLGFTEYGRLTDYAAFGERRYDMVMCKLDFRV
jgi:ribosomal protein S18 acetylase RimI-like enzyme